MGTGVGEAMLISAATGGGMAAVTGGDPLKGALLGAVTGGVGHGIAGATAAGGANVLLVLLRQQVQGWRLVCKRYLVEQMQLLI
jgi:hypothetical protein